MSDAVRASGRTGARLLRKEKDRRSTGDHAKHNQSPQGVPAVDTRTRATRRRFTRRCAAGRRTVACRSGQLTGAAPSNRDARKHAERSFGPQSRNDRTRDASGETTASGTDPCRNPLPTAGTTARYPAGGSQTYRGERKDRGRKSAVLSTNISHEPWRVRKQSTGIRLRRGKCLLVRGRVADTADFRRRSHSQQLPALCRATARDDFGLPEYDPQCAEGYLEFPRYLPRD